MCGRQIISTVIKLLLVNAAGVKRYLQMDISERFWRIMALSHRRRISLSVRVSPAAAAAASPSQDSSLSARGGGGEKKNRAECCDCLMTFPSDPSAGALFDAGFLLFLSILTRISRRRTIEHLK
jgi:hypothetical protein